MFLYDYNLLNKTKNDVFGQLDCLGYFFLNGKWVDFRGTKQRCATKLEGMKENSKCPILDRSLTISKDVVKAGGIPTQTFRPYLKGSSEPLPAAHL